MPDAYLIDHSYPAGKRDTDRLQALNREFAPGLGAAKVWVRRVYVGNKDLLTAKPEAPTYLFPRGHTLEGTDRYSWSDRGDGVLAGTLLPDPLAPDVVARLAAEEQARRVARGNTPEGIKASTGAALKQGVITPGEASATLAAIPQEASSAK